MSDVQVSFTYSNVIFSFDPEKVNLKTILKAIQNAGYIASEKPPERPRKSLPEIKPASPQSTPKDNKPVTVIRKVLKIDGMTCQSCEMRIENKLKKTEGVLETHVSYTNGTAKISYDPRVISLSRIIEIIEKLDYKVVSNPANKKSSCAATEKSAEIIPVNQIIGIGIILLAGYLIIKNTIGFSFIPSVNQNMGYDILFVVGLITSLHCAAMCGGINLSSVYLISTPITAISGQS